LCSPLCGGALGPPWETVAAYRQDLRDVQAVRAGRRVKVERVRTVPSEDAVHHEGVDMDGQLSTGRRLLFAARNSWSPMPKYRATAITGR